MYLGWAWCRWNLWDIAHDASWPHGFPYPDKALMALEHYWNQANPAPRGMIKMTGEFARVKQTVGVAAILFATVGVLCGLPTLFGSIRRAALNRQGFPPILKE